MSVNYEIYASTTLSPPFRVIKSMLAASPLPVDFNDGPFAASLLRNAAWDYSSFDVIAEDTLADGDTIALCRQADAKEMQSVLQSSTKEALSAFFSRPGRGLAPLTILDPFDFSSVYEDQPAWDVLGVDDSDPAAAILETANWCCSVTARGEGWVQYILAHILAKSVYGLFVDPQSDERTLYN